MEKAEKARVREARLEHLESFAAMAQSKWDHAEYVTKTDWDETIRCLGWDPGGVRIDYDMVDGELIPSGPIQWPWLTRAWKDLPKFLKHLEGLYGS